MKLLIHSASQIVCVVRNGSRMLCGSEMNELHIMTSNTRQCGYSVAVDNAGKIAAVGTDEEILTRFSRNDFLNIVDAANCSVLPGFVDCHCHPVWAGDRIDEFKMKLEGATYMDIHQKGGGIHFTVEHTRAATEEKLYEDLVKRLSSMVKSGSTLVECKTGYGLNLETEVKMLRVIQRAKLNLPIDVTTTYLAAHAVPRGQTADEMTEEILMNHFPSLERLRNSGDVNIDQIDVFCEKGVFNVDQTKAILEKGQKLGMSANFHGEELSYMASAEMGASIGACAISHLELVSDDGIDAMAEHGTVAVLLPSTAFVLHLPRPPVKKMIDRGVAIALGSDFNPNVYCCSMGITMYLACITFGMTMEQALAAATINSAAALGQSKLHGSVEPGKFANLLVLNSSRWEDCIYQFGCPETIRYVINHGDIVHSSCHMA